MSEKVREFNLCQHNDGYRGFFTAEEVNGPIPFKENGITVFHVIEYSAYQSLQSELDRYRCAYKELELSMQNIGHQVNFYLNEEEKTAFNICNRLARQALESARKLLNEQTEG
jgi:hypothetical protein